MRCVFLIPNLSISPKITMYRHCQFLLVCCLLMSYGCFSNKGGNQTTVHYLSTLKSESDFTMLEGKPLSSKFSHITSVKVVYSLGDKKIYFVNSHYYKYHYDFVAEYLGNREDLYYFNEKNYSSGIGGNRQFLLGNLNHIKGSDTYFLELSPSDQMDIAYIESLFEEVKKSCDLAKNLQFYLNSYRLLKASEDNELKLPKLKSEDLFGSVKYQQISAGKVTGILKKYTLEELETTLPNKNEIIVLDATPLTLPQVKGIIVTELQTPLSHLVLLGRNRKIPIVAYTDALKDNRIQSMMGKKVSFEALEDSMKIVEDQQGDIESDERPEIILKKDLTQTGLIPLDKVPMDGKDFIGSKAYHFSCLSVISRKKESFKVPEYGFAIPFAYYQQHVEASGAWEQIKLLEQGKYRNAVEVKEALQKIRKSINQYPLDKNLLTSVERLLHAQHDYKTFRFRSSTNAEDLGEFNGAGLYDSKSVVLGDTSKTIEKAIKKVWASAWSEGAYNERLIFNIKQSSVAMGILVHRSFPDEMANGVVITTNIYRETDGITVNVQKGESSVVLPEKGITTEIFAAYKYEQPPWVGKLIVDYTSHSPLNDYKPIMNEKEMENLYDACMDIHTGMIKYWGVGEVCDIEFKLVGPKRELYIKQVRIY